MNASSIPQIPSPTPSEPRLRAGMVGRLFVMACLVGAFGIGLVMIRSVLAERRGHRDEAIDSIASTWGREQEIFGPVLMVPFRVMVKATKEERVGNETRLREVLQPAIARACFLPEALAVDGRLDPSRRYRGIYEAVVYGGALSFQGRFAPPDFTPWRTRQEGILWDEAEIVVGVSDLRGTRRTVSLSFAGRTAEMEPTTTAPLTGTGLRARVGRSLRPGSADPGPLDFRFDLTLNGSGSLQVAPAGVSNRVELAAAWPDPSFAGSFLPSARTIDESGFRAAWDVTYYGRRFPQQWCLEPNGGGEPGADAISASLFGVRLLSPVDSYRIVERSIKYGVLIVVLTFTILLLFELLAGVRVHPFQYAAIAAALCLFYLGFLSLSEFFAVGPSYAAGAAVCTAMIALYTRRTLGTAGRTLALTAGLVCLYGFLYVVLRSQDYSLITGTAGLFVALGLVMWATRRVAWYGARDDATPRA